MKKVLLFVGGEYHDIAANGELIRKALEASGENQISVVRDTKALRECAKYDAVALYAQDDVIADGGQRSLVNFVKEGGALLALHSANVLRRCNDFYREMLGSRFLTHGPIAEFEVFVDLPDHDIVRRVPDFKIVDELYSIERDNDVDVFASAFWHGKKAPMGYSKSFGKGNVVHLANGHDERSLTHPMFTKMMSRGLDYALGKRETGEVRCGIIGYGGAFNMGKLHGNQINASIGMRTVAVCDLDKARADEATVDFPDAEVFNSVDALLKKPDLDLCVIITPHNTHAPIALKCLRAGKSVVSEKPFCLSLKEADAMIAAARESNVTLTVYHNRRYDGDYLALKEIIASGVIGRVFKVEASFGGYGRPGPWWRSDKRISGGAFYDWGAHFMDWILNLVPEPIESVSGQFFNKLHWHHVTNEDHCEASIRFKNGVVASLQMSALNSVPVPRWRVLGTEGGVIDDRAVEGHFTVVSHRTGESVKMHIPFKQGKWDRYYPALADHLLRGEELVVKPEEARRVIGAIEYAERSAKAGKPLTIPGEGK